MPQFSSPLYRDQSALQSKAVLKTNLKANDRTVCRSSLGMESGAIPDDSITASSQMRLRPGDSRYAPFRGRLNLVTGDAGWAAVGTATIGEWLQVDLGEMKHVTGIITQGGMWYSPQMWVTSFKLQYSTDATCWVTYATSDGSDKVFSGNTDATTPVINMLPDPIDVRYVRFLPQAWYFSMSMRVEVLGCRAYRSGGSGHTSPGCGRDQGNRVIPKLEGTDTHVDAGLF
ncbi:lactadherin-like [Branchiostoma lanceolatum]|uniref:lactadherin-like n=1 Tax=Branchiostoma lanceolatum TaxID=7740 RepID=UPI0034550B85